MSEERRDVPGEAETVTGSGAFYLKPTDAISHAASHRYLAALIKSSEDAIITETVDGIITSWNPTASRLYGYAASEVIGRSISIIIPEDRKLELERILSRIASGKRVEHFDTVRVRKNGERVSISLSVSPIHDDDGVVLGAASIARDITDRKRAEQAREALRESKERLQFTLEAARVGTWDWDLGTNVVNWSSNLEEIHGRAPGSFANTFDSVLEDVFPEDRAVMDAAIKEAISEGSDYHVAYRVLQSDGRIIWIEGKGKTSFDEDGRPIRMAGICMDVTERKEAEREIERLNRDLQRRLDEFQIVFDVTPVGLGIAHDPACERISVNPVFARMLGIAPDENASKTRFDDVELPFRVFQNGIEVPPDLLPMQLAAARGDEIRDAEFEIVRSDGQALILLEYASPLYDEDGGIRGSVGAFVDITELKDAERALRESEHRFRQLADAMPQIVWIADPNGAPSFVNQQWRDYTGVATTPAPDAPRLQQVIHPDDADRVFDLWRESAASQAVFEAEYRLRASSGQYRWFLARAVPIRNEDAEVVEWFGTSTDIDDRIEAETNLRLLNETLEERVAERTAALKRLNSRLKAEVRERARAERALELANRALTQSNRELQDFAYAASHDLQEPLRKISSFVDLVRARQADYLDDEGHFFLDRMQNAALRMTELIRDLLAFSRVKTRGKAFEQIQLSSVLHDVSDDLEFQIQEVGGRLDIGKLPALEADPTQMRQLFQNLISNALKFHRPDELPVVTVRTDLEAPPGTCRILVEDNGIGFDEKYLDRIFSPFQRLHGRSSFPGTGIGLAICRRIIERHQGEITARSAPDQGATFVITLPLVQQQIGE